MNTVLKKSLEGKQPIEMIYLAKDNQITHRKIIVKELHVNYF